MNQSNVAPAALLRGVNDESGRALPNVVEALPQHLPLCPLYTERGDSDKPLLVSGSSAIRTFGAKSFSYREKFAKHQTALFNVVNAEGNACFIQRLIPAGAVKATLRLSVEIVQSVIPVTLRNSDGSYALDINGDVQLDGSNTVDGSRVRWLIEDASSDFGVGPVQAGTLAPHVSPGSDLITSQVFPIVDFEADFGSYGNNIGIRISAPTVNSPEALNLDDVEDIGSYLYRIQFMEKQNANSTPRVVPNAGGERYLDFSFNDDDYNEATSTEMGLTKQVSTWVTPATNAAPKIDSPFKTMSLYSANIATVLATLATAENAVTGDGVDDGMFNFVSAVDGYGIPYQTFEVLGPLDGGISLTETSTHFASDGEDGDVSDASYDAAVAEYFNGFETHPANLMDDAVYPISDIWDSGFTSDTKDALLVPMSLRKDIMTTLATQDASRPANSASEDSSIGIALRTAVSMFPESSYYGTAIVRAGIVPRCGTMVNSEYKGILPMTIDLAQKVARYMGAADGRYKTGYAFDVDAARQVSLIENINVTYTPSVVRNKDWSNGLMYVQSYGRNSSFYPAFPSAHPNKTSVLSSYLVARAVTELEKVALRSWRALTGASIPRDLFIEKSNQTILDLTAGRFDGRYVVVPDTYFTNFDDASGFSYSCNISLYANNSIYVGQFTITSRRMEDLANG